jgi:hypothetical protein
MSNRGVVLYILDTNRDCLYVKVQRNIGLCKWISNRDSSVENRIIMVTTREAPHMCTRSGGLMYSFRTVESTIHVSYFVFIV